MLALNFKKHATSVYCNYLVQSLSYLRESDPGKLSFSKRKVGGGREVGDRMAKHGSQREVGDGGREAGYAVVEADPEREMGEGPRQVVHGLVEKIAKCKMGERIWEVVYRFVETVC